MAKDELTDDDIEEIAHITRGYWNLGEGPIDNLTFLMEKNGIVISGSMISSEKTDACSQIQNGVPIVFYNKNLRSACRIRFSLAHELGHILMHNHITATDLRDSKTLDRVEHQAYRFASAFLMPDVSFVSDIHSLALNFLITLKEKWRTSVAAIIVRCKDLMLIDQDTYTTLWRQLSYKRWRKIEPLDDIIPIESPRLLKAALEFLINKSTISRQEILGEFSWSIDDISDIFCIQKSFFDDSPDFSTQLKLI